MMTDKEIIIDGVDVSECRYLFDDTSYKRSKTSCSITLKDCKYLGDKCYFKQLKRKEQECEELKRELHQNFEEKDKLHLIIDRLLEASGYDTNTASAEDFEDVYENMHYEKQQLHQLETENEELKNAYTRLNSLYNDNCNFTDKLEKSLTEIKEIADKDFRHTAWEEYAKQLKQILQKISECEVENEYNTKDIRHINEKNQEYIAEGNRMTKMNREQKERIKGKKCARCGKYKSNYIIEDIALTTYVKEV